MKNEKGGMKNFQLRAARHFCFFILHF